MTISKVIIANMALARLGTRNSIESLTEQSVEAKASNLWYDHSRLMTLEGYNWSFARKRQALALSNEDPPTGLWGYRYIYPADCIKARELELPDYYSSNVFNVSDVFDRFAPQPDAIPFTIEMQSDNETKSILTDLNEAVLIYTFDQNNISSFSRHFIDTVAYALAYNMAMQLTGRQSIQDKMLQSFSFMLFTASTHDGNEHVARPPREAEAIRSRIT